jgi:hypothetical protein
MRREIDGVFYDLILTRWARGDIYLIVELVRFPLDLNSILEVLFSNSIEIWIINNVRNCFN